MPTAFREMLAPRVCAAAAALSCAATSPISQGQIPCRYEIAQVFEGPECGIFGPAPTSAWSISPNGQYVVGNYSPCGGPNDRAFYWSEASGMVTIPLPANTAAMQALDVNDNFQVVGTCWGGTAGTRGFIYTVPLGQFRFVNNLSLGQCEISAINNAGVSCGLRTFDTPNNLYSAFIRSADGVITDLGVINGPRSAATDIAEDGTVIGWTGIGNAIGRRGFIYRGGNVNVIPPVGTGGSSSPTSINGNHMIVGDGVLPTPNGNVNRAFIYSQGKMTVLEPPANYSRSRAHSINDLGIVTGMYWDSVPPGEDGIPVVYYAGQVVATVDLIDPGRNIQWGGAGKISGDNALAGIAFTKGHSVGVVLRQVADEVLGDVDHNCTTNIDDLVRVIIDWGMTESPADLNKDFVVDFYDLLIVIQNWSST